MLIEDQALLDIAPYSVSQDAESVNVYIWMHNMGAEELLAFTQKHFQEIPDDILLLSNNKRKVERLSVHLLLRQLLGEKACLAYHDTGRPYLQDCPLHISISHSTHLYAISIAPFRHGLDIEQWGGKALRLLSRFISPEEETSLPSVEALQVSPEQRATLLWSAKEAAYKFYDIPGTTLHPDFILKPTTEKHLEVICQKSPEAASILLEATTDCALTCCAARPFAIK